MQLYMSLTSPYSRKVRVMLSEKGVAYEAINVADGTRNAAERNPLGKVPTLILDDGTLLFDSTVITEALDVLWPEPRLIPSETEGRFIVRRWEALADGIVDVLIPYVLETRRPAERQDPAYAEKLYNKARASLSYLDTSLQGRQFLHGTRFSLADIAAVSAAGYANLRAPKLLEGLPALAEYIAFQLERPSLCDTLPPNLPFRG